MKKEAAGIFSGCENCDKIVMNVMTDFFLAAHGIAIGYLPNNVGSTSQFLRHLVKQYSNKHVINSEMDAKIKPVI